jgi:hypothetical protein
MIKLFESVANTAKQFIADEKYKEYYNYITGKELTGVGLLRDASNFIYPFLGLNANITANRYLTTEVSFLFVPYTGFIPFHTYTETYLMDNEVEYTPSLIEANTEDEKTNDKGYYIAPAIGEVTYQRSVQINGEFYRDNNNKPIWGALSAKMPDMMGALWATLSMLPAQTPAFFFSKKIGRFIGQPAIIDNIFKSETKEKKILLLNSVELGLDSNSEKMTFNVKLIESNESDYGTVNSVPLGDTALQMVRDIRNGFLGF